MSDIRLKNFTELSDEEKKMVLQWRNHDTIRKWMYQKEPISLIDHLTYIDALKEKRDRCYFLVEKERRPIGVIDFTSIDRHKGSAEIGVYAAPTQKGVGRDLMQAVLKHGFKHMQLHKLVSNVYVCNKRAIKLYHAFGFCEVKRDQELIYMELTDENR